MFAPVAADDPAHPSGSEGGVTDSGQVIAPNTPGTWEIETCFNGSGPDRFGQLIFIPAGSQAAPSDLLIEARRHLALPAPAIQMSPASDHLQYVQMPTWAWIPKSEWVPLTSTVSAGPVSVTVTATPVEMDVTYQINGDGTTATATCKGPGTPYSDQLADREDPQRPVLAASPDCGWTWHQSSDDTPNLEYTVTAHVLYHTVWVVLGAAGGGDLGQLPSLNTTHQVAVGEIQALITPPH